MKKIFLFITLFLCLFFGGYVLKGNADTIDLYFFHGEGCPHCTKAKPFIDYLSQKYPSLQIHSYEVWYNKDNHNIFIEKLQEYNLDSTGVPKFFIEGDYISGFGTAETTGKKIEELVRNHLGDLVLLFDDIDSSNYAQAINYLKEQAIVNGYDDGTFRPHIMINRAEFMKILIEAKYPGKANGSGCFSDVGAEWFAKYVCFAKNNNIIRGYDDGTFKPSQNINYVEALKVITETYGVATSNIQGEWYETYVDAAKRNRYFLEEKIALDEYIKREHMAGMIFQLLSDV